VIPPLRGWSARWDGTGAELVPAAGAGVAAIRYEERVRPVQALVEVARDLAAGDSSLLVERIGEAHGVISHEGEYGAIVRVEARLAGRPVHQVLGALYADDFYSLTVGVSREASFHDELARTVEQLVRSDTHMLGVRRRRFLHDAPAGWRRSVHGVFHTRYLLESHDRDADDGATIAVSPAIPAPASGPARMVAALEMAATLLGAGVRSVEPVAVARPAGFAHAWRWERASGRVLVVLEDARFLYPIAMMSSGPFRARARGAFDQVVASAQPIPSPQAGVEPTLLQPPFGDAVHASHWAD
jgi:hypothetical protein